MTCETLEYTDFCIGNLTVTRINAFFLKRFYKFLQTKVSGLQTINTAIQTDSWKSMFINEDPFF